MAVDTSLSERKLTILKAIIQNYLETGEPVGSRTLSKYTDLNLSSATIRNEMADLEDLGYIFQPHTSAGRIPSDKGYRLYVDTMMEEKQREITEMKELMIEKADKMEQVLQQVAKERSIPWQTKSKIAWGTDARAIQRTAAGCRVAAVSAAVRYIHSPSSVGSVQDFKHMKTLLMGSLEKLEEQNA